MSEVATLRKEAVELDMKFSKAFTSRDYDEAALIAGKLATKYQLITLLCEDLHNAK